MKRQNPEQQFHKAVAQFLRASVRAPTMWTTFPAGGGGRVRGAFLKTMGLQAGWPDLLVFHPHPNTGLIVVGIELKAGKNDQTAEQRYVQECFFQCGAWYVLCRSIDEVERCLRFCKVPIYGAVARAA